MNINNIF